MRPQPGGVDDLDSRMRILCRRCADWDASVDRVFTHDRGIYCVKMSTLYGSVYCIAKAYVHKDRASFPRKVVHRGLSNESLLGIFFGNDLYLGDGYVFSSQTVYELGTQNRGGSDKDDQRIWVDIPIERGVNFGNFLTGREFPE